MVSNVRKKNLVEVFAQFVAGDDNKIVDALSHAHDKRQREEKLQFVRLECLRIFKRCASVNVADVSNMQMQHALQQMANESLPETGSAAVRRQADAPNNVAVGLQLDVE